MSAPAVRASGREAARLVSRGAGLLLLAVAALTAQPPARYALGAPRERVLAIQGRPELVERLASLGVEVWSYGGASLRFDAATGLLAGWNDPERRLKVELRPARAAGESNRELSLGTPRDDVARLFGTPWSYLLDVERNAGYLAYGRSVIRVSAPDGRVTGWIRRDSAIRVSDADDPAARHAMGAGAQTTARGGDPIAPASLSGRVFWRDGDGDGVVAIGEGVRVEVTITNAGPGVAADVAVEAAVESPRDGVRVTLPAAIRTLAAGGAATVVVTLRADSASTASELIVVIGARERSGFDLAPRLRVRLPARSAGAPRIVVRDTRVDDASRDGRLAPRELADVTIRVANEGNAHTPVLSGRFVLGSDLFIAAGAPATFALGAIAPGATADIAASLYSNSRAIDVSALLEFTDLESRVLARLPIAIPFEARPGAVVDVQAPNSGRDAAAPTVEDIERDLPRAAARNPDAVAVILGIDRYRSLPDARWAARDAALVRRYAVNVLGVPDDQEHVFFRTDGDATGSEFRKVFGETGWLARRVDENTDLFVYYAGHGAPDAGRAPHLLPFDADAAYVRETGFELSQLYDRLARLPARSITIVLDACFTGLTRDRRALVPGARPIVISVEHPALIRRNMAVLVASRDAQVAGDLPEARHGLFTYFVARGLRGEADTNDDRSITVAELGHFLDRTVPRAASRLDREQRPLMIARDSTRVLARLAPKR